MLTTLVDKYKKHLNYEPCSFFYKTLILKKLFPLKYYVPITFKSIYIIILNIDPHFYDRKLHLTEYTTHSYKLGAQLDFT